MGFVMIKIQFTKRARTYLLAALIISAATLPARLCRAEEKTELPTFAATWESLNGRHSPEWFGDAKFGIFIHWGVYAVPSFCDTSTYSEWYLWWLKTNAHDGLERKFHERVYGKDFAYRQFAPMFKAELWNPDRWAAIFKRSGAKYVVLTTKHHDGFCLWPSRIASQVRGYPWNSMETGPQRDLVGELTESVRKIGLRMGFYYSFMEWDNPVFDRDKGEYVNTVMWPQMKELVTKYQPDIFWPDGEWNDPDTLWRSEEFLAWLYNHAPNRQEIVVNDRWGKELRAKSGDFYTTEYSRHAGEGATGGRKPFEECRGIAHSFAFNRAEEYDIYLSRTKAVRMLIDMVSQGGNLLLDVGPTADGRIPLLMQDRLFAIGRWLNVNGEAIYGTTAGPFKELPWGRATTKGQTLYLHVYDWPERGELVVPGLANNVKSATVLSDDKERLLRVKKQDPHGIRIDLSGQRPFEHATVVALQLDGDPKVDVGQ